MKVVVSSISFSKNLALVKKLKTFFPDSVVNELGKRYEGDDLIEYFKDADAVILAVEKVDDKLLG